MKSYEILENDVLKKIKLSHLPDGRLSTKQQDIFNNNGQILSSRSWNGYENRLDKEIIYKYDERGNLLEISMPINYGVERQTTTFKYDDRDLLLEVDGIHYKFTYTYSNCGLLIEEFYYSNDVLYNRTTYKYDSKDNWIEKTVYENDNLIRITRRKIEYYE
jgi:hypothetical protein